MVPPALPQTRAYVQMDGKVQRVESVVRTYSCSSPWDTFSIQSNDDCSHRDCDGLKTCVLDLVDRTREEVLSEHTLHDDTEACTVRFRCFFNEFDRGLFVSRDPRAESQTNGGELDVRGMCDFSLPPLLTEQRS